jgi:hypothetical protein
MTDQQAQRAMVSVVLAWLRGDTETESFIAEYWSTRRELLSSNWSAFSGPFGQIMSAMDTAADSYSDEPNVSLAEINEGQLRTEAEEVVKRLRGADLLGNADAP